MRFISIFSSLLLFLFFSAQASETVKGVQIDFENFKTEMSAKLDATEKELVELRIKAKQKGSAAKAEVVADLENTRDQLRSQLSKMDDSAKENWKKFKESFAKSIENLNSKIQNSLKE